MRKIMVFSMLAMIILGSAAFLVAQDDSTKIVIDSAVVDTMQKADETAKDDRFVAYYFHGDRRCVTCRKLEAFSQEAIAAGFEKELKDSVLVWQAVNYDEKDNKHFIEDYKLYTKAVILSQVRNGKEVAFKNLDKIWQLVGDKDRYIAYVQEETRAFMDPESKE